MEKNKNDPGQQPQQREKNYESKKVSSIKSRFSLRNLLLVAYSVIFVTGFLFVSSRSQAEPASITPSLEIQKTSIPNFITPAAEVEKQVETISPTEAVQPTEAALSEPAADTPKPSPTTQFESAEINIPAFTPTGALPTPSSWSGDSRINILLLGLDYGDWDSPERDGPPRTDTMVLVSIDTSAKTAGILSIPRDLWVDIPGMIRPNKINAAYRFGEYYNLPGGGPGLAMKTVEQLTGVPINYYVELDFYAFERIIDEMGGIEVAVQEEIKVHRLSPGGSVILEPGSHIVDGATALAYARNRSTSGGDFDRSIRQQQIMIGVRNTILKLDNLPNLILSAPVLYREVSGGLKTNLSLDKIVQLVWLSQTIPQENIQLAMIGPGEVLYDRSADGQSILRPVPFRIQQQVNKVLSIPTSNPDLTKRMQAEEANLYILNASGTEKLEELTAGFLISEGAIVVQEDDSEEIVSKTSIIDYSGKPYTVQYLARLMSIPSSEILTDYDPFREEDILIVLGSDWQRKNNLNR